MASEAHHKQRTTSGKVTSMKTDTRKSQVGAKEAIGTFCLLLYHHGALRLSPELLRQAKFDREEAVVPMWELLHQLTVFTLQHQFPKYDQSPLTTNAEEVIQNIKHTMWWHGYRCRDFFNLLPDMTSGSQELLLACGWLIAQTDLISKLMESNQVPFIGGDTAFVHAQESHYKIHRVTNRQCHTARKTLSPSGQVKHLAWMAGRCKMALRGLYMRQQELCHLAHQIHMATQGVSISCDLQHLSVLETFLLRHPHHMQKYQDMLHAEVLRLQTCVKWMDQEYVFWQWMESVLDAKLSKDNEQHGQIDSPLDNFIPSSTSKIAMQTSRELQQVCKELSGIISQVQGCLKHLPENQPQQISEDIELIKRDIVSDVGKMFEAIQTKITSSKKQPIRLQYTPAEDKLSKTSKSNKHIGRVTVREEIDRLEAIVQGLELQHRQLREKLRYDMDMITDKLSGAVCIPPMGQTMY